MFILYSRDTFTIDKVYDTLYSIEKINSWSSDRRPLQRVFLFMIGIRVVMEWTGLRLMIVIVYYFCKKNGDKKKDCPKWQNINKFVVTDQKGQPGNFGETSLVEDDLQ